MSFRHGTRWNGSVVLGGLVTAFGLLCAATGVAPIGKTGYEIGQRWQYRHEGPRPGSIEPNAIDGERILWVVSVVEEQGRPQAIIEERFTRGKDVVGRLYVDQDGLLTTLEIRNEKGERAKLRYDPPVPYQPPDMNVGETRTIQTTLRMDSANLALPSKTVIERLIDETVRTPAGEFAGCTHFKRTTTSTVDLKIARIPVTEEREQWYHPSINGMIKEVYRKGPVKFLGWSRPGYTATSTLMTYGREEGVSGGGPAAPANIEQSEHQEASPSRSTGTRWGSRELILTGTLALMAGALVLAKRAHRRRG